MIHEKIVKPASGFGMLIMIFVAFFFVPVFSLTGNPFLALLGIFMGIVAFFCLFGFIVINPNESSILTLFGTYKGTAKENGFYWVNPFYGKQKVSLRARNLEGKIIKVNDKVGNPIEIAVVVVWKVEETALAAFAVDNYHKYVEVQSEAALRHIAGTHAYDNFEAEGQVMGVTLKDGGDAVNQLLITELEERLALAGIKIVEARLSHLAYAQEIAGAMLQRQQAMAIVAARTTIVEGAVGMVEMALEKLSHRNIVHLDEERKAAMVSNLLVVLCAEKSVSPVVNTGSIY